jgi:hypothetical protein
MKVGIPIPDTFDAESLFLYGVDEFGHLYAIDFENTYGIAYFATDVLGTFILVQGELELPDYSEEGDQPVDGDEPTDGDEPEEGDNPAEDDKPADTKPDDKDDKDDKKDNKSNGWILWVVIGGVVLLAAAGVAVFFVLKKKKGAK